MAALLPHQAVRGPSAGEPAGAGLAGAAAHTVIVRLTLLTVPDTGPLVQGTWYEARQTLALSLSASDGALSVGTAGVVTNVLTPTTHTDTLVWAVPVPSGAAPFRETPGLVRVAHLTLWAQTTEPGSCGSAVGGTVTGIVTAGVKSGAPGLWDRVWLGSWRTGTLRSLVLWQTDGVNSTGVRGTDVHAGEAQSVAELAGRTVGVGETVDSPAAFHWVIGVSLELARGTAAPGGVVLGDADGLGAAGDGGAGRDTLLEGGAADLLLSTLGVSLTLVLVGESAARPGPGVAAVPFIAEAGALVVTGPALGVGRTGEQLADRSTTEDSEIVGLTHLVLATLRVSGAGGHGGDLALVGDGVPDVAGAALAVRLVVLHHALLVVAAAHHPAGVDTALLAADVDAADLPWRTVRLGPAAGLPATALERVERVPGEPVLTDAGAVMIVRHTPRVGSALDVPACVHTPVLALHRLADLVVAAVKVGGAA